MAASSTTAHHVLDVLLLFNESRPTLTAEEIGDLIDAPRSSTYRYIRTLRERGLLKKTADGGFTLGPRIWQLAQAANQGQDGGNATQLVMQSLSRRTRETIALSHLFDRTAVCIDSIEGLQTVRINVERGQVQPLHATAASKVLLAHLPEETWDNYLDEPLEAFTEHTITDPQLLKAQLRQIRAQGYGTSENEIELGVRAIAVPILDRKHDRVLALAVVGPTFRLNDQLVDEYRELLQAAATAIQAQAPGTLL